MSTLGISNVTSLFQATSNFYMSIIAAPKKIDNSRINRLPDEMLRHIFLEAVFARNDRVSVTLVTPAPAADCAMSHLILCRVCKRWRDIIYGSQEFWRSIVITRPNAYHVDNTHTWMTLHKNRPLDVTITRGARSQKESDTKYNKILFEIVAKRVEDWRRIKLDLHPEMVSGIAYLFANNLPTGPDGKLTDADLTFYRLETRPNAIDFIWDALQNMHSLRKLVWTSSFAPNATFSASLQELELRCPISLRDMVNKVLARLPFLVSLTANNICRPPMGMDQTSRRTTHPHLRFLSLKTRGVNVRPLISRVRAPRLSHLELSGDLVHENRFDVQSLVKASQCRLHGFAFDVPNAPAQDTLDWLQMREVQQVDMLTVAGAHITDDVLKLLTRPAQSEDQTCYFPHLKDLGLATCRADVDVDVLMRMLGSRFWVPSSGWAVGGICGMDTGEEKLTELLTAQVYVAESALTTKLEEYAIMINSCSDRIKDWKDRDLKFTVVPG